MILLVNNHSKNISLIEDILRKLKVRFVVKDQKSLFKNFEQHRIKGVILSGGGPSLDKKLYLNQIRANLACLVNYDVPILGICEGHQIIGAVHGSKIMKLKKPAYRTNLKIRILKKSKIFEDFPDTIEVYEHHSRYVRNVPDELIVTVSYRKDEIEAIFHRKKPIFGVQFHPERSGEVGERILKNFVNLCD